MESKNRNTWIIVGLAVAAAIIMCLCALCAAAFTFLPRNAGSFDIGFFGPAAGVKVSDVAPIQEFSVRPHSKLAVENEVGDIVVRVGSGDLITIEATKHARAANQDRALSVLDRIEIDTSSNGETTNIKVDLPNNLGAGGASVDFVITAPAQTRLEINNQVGDVEVQGLEERMDVRVDVGDIDLSSVTLADDSELKSDVGDVQFAGILPDSGEVEFQSDVGDIRLWLPSNSSFYLEADTSVGSIDTDFPIDVDDSGSTFSPGAKLEGSVGVDPETTLKLHTGTGSIVIRQR